MSPILLSLLLAFLAGCQLTGPGRPATLPDSLVVRSGTSYGECLGYCRTDLELRGGVAVLTQRGTSPQAFPDRRVERPVPDSVTAAVGAYLDVGSFFMLEDVYGCPDCADGGAEWIEIEDGDRVKRVTFERHDPPPGLGRLARTLDRYRESLVDLFG